MSFKAQTFDIIVSHRLVSHKLTVFLAGMVLDEHKKIYTYISKTSLTREI